MPVTEDISINPYFAGLSPEEMESISRYFFERELDRGQILLFEGDAAEALYFVRSGVVKVFKTSAEGKEQIIQLVRPGESFNDVPVLEDGTNLANAEAMGKVVVVWGIKKSDLEAVMSQHPRLALNIIQVLSGRIRHLLSLVEDLSFKHVTGRVAGILLDYAGGENPRLTQQDMAAMAGTAREMVGRSLKSLEEEGAIRLDHHRIVIRDRERLHEIAGV